jgi:AraC-like DNA-binding protein
MPSVIASPTNSTLTTPDWHLIEIPVKPIHADHLGTLYYLHLPSKPDNALRRIIAMASLSLDVMINLGDPFTIETFCDAIQVNQGPYLAGPRPTTAFIRRQGELTLLGARFKHGAVAPLLPYPVKELEQRILPLSAVWPDTAAALGKIGNRQTPLSTLVENMEGAFTELLTKARKPDPMVRKAVKLIAQHQGDLEVSAMAAALGVSRQTVKHKFDQHVGVSPKLFGKLRRFQAVLGRLTSVTKVNWTQLARDSGYYDQAHLTREFNHFTGFSPQKFMKNLEKGEDLYLFDTVDQTHYHLTLRQDAASVRADGTGPKEA